MMVIRLDPPLSIEIEQLIGPYGDTPEEVVSFIIRHWLSSNAISTSKRIEQWKEWLKTVDRNKGAARATESIRSRS